MDMRTITSAALTALLVVRKAGAHAGTYKTKLMF